MRGKDAAQELTLKVNIFTGIHHRFLRDKSLSWITSRNRMDRTKVQRDGRTCKNKSHVPSLQKNSNDTKDNGVSHWTSRWKTRRCGFDPIFELGFFFFSKKSLHHESGEEVTQPIQFSTAIQEMSLFLKRFLVGHVQKVGGAHDHFLGGHFILFYYSWFLLQLIGIHFTRLCADRNTSHVFSHTLCTRDYTHIVVQECIRAHHLIPMIIHDEQLSVCSLLLCSSLCSFPCVSYTYLFSHHFYLYLVLNLFFHVDNAKAINPRASANWGVLLSGRIHTSHRSSWFLCMGFTVVKITVCFSLLEFCAPNINPEVVMECKLIAHPKW